MAQRIIDPRLIQAFMTVAAERNVSRAADKLHLSQPAVSLQLKQLSELLGLELFDRTSAGLNLTRDGAALLPSAHRALAALNEFSVSADRLRGGVRGVLRLGTILDPEYTRLGAFLNTLMSLAPDIQPELRHGVSGEILRLLDADALDLAYYIGQASKDGQPLPDQTRHPDLFFMHLSTCRYRVVAPKGWAERVEGKGWEALFQMPWIMTPKDSVHNRLLCSLPGFEAVEHGKVAVVDLESSMLALVRSGVGLALARDSIALAEQQRFGVVVSDSVELEADLCVVCKKGAQHRPLVRAAMDALLSVFAQAPLQGE